MLAYSSVAQIGYIIIGVSLATVTGLTAAIVHMFNHGLIKAALFCALGCVFYRIGSVRIGRMAGLAKEMPWTMAAFVAGGLSLIGVPLTAGFISKWFLIQGALEQGLWWLAALIMLSSLLAVVYIWRVVEVAYFKPRPDDRAAVLEAPLTMLIPTWFLVLANFYFGIDTALPVQAAQRAAVGLVRGFW